MHGYPPDQPPHVAQQSRRDRLRYRPAPAVEAPLSHFQDVPHHSDPMNSGAANFADGQAMYLSGAMLGYTSGAQAEASDSCISPNPSFSGNLLFAAAAASHVGNNVQNSNLWKILPGTDWTSVNPGYEDVTMSSSMTTSSNAMIQTQQSQSQFGGEILPLGSSSATPDESGGLEVTPFVRHNTPWMGCGNNELALLPSYSSTSTINSAQQQWRSLSNFEGDGSTQGLSLSLSSMLPSDSPLVPSYDMKLETDAYPLNSISPGVIFPDIIQHPNPSARSHSNELSSSCRSLFITQGVVGLPTVDSHRVVGPLGPFTGYATILRNSKFLKPAQQLLDECCHPAMTPVDASERLHSSKAESPRSKVAGVSDVNMRGGRSGGWEGGHFRDPQIQQKKAKLLFMQGEVCRRQKHYNQQIQMAISSFESVAGLSTAMPFLSLALKSIVKHFRFLKSLISEQLLDVRRVLGEEFPSPSSCYGKSGASTAASRSNLFDQPIPKLTEEAGGLGLLEQGQALARPQRGLPERAVAVLRAWLFDHFLHPYPTDTDKLMLATQTGLTRNQVSNWFINARVRVWKPMVEEIHMLESKGLSDVGDLNSLKDDDALVAIGNEGSTAAATMDRQDHQQPISNCSTERYWHPAEKRSKLEQQQQHLGITEGVDGGMAAFSAYPSGFEMGSGVSLTLGLKHEENSNHQQHIRSYLGSQLVQEFVG